VRAWPSVWRQPTSSMPSASCSSCEVSQRIYVRTIALSSRNPGSRCHNPTCGRLPIDAIGGIGVSTEVLLTSPGGSCCVERSITGSNPLFLLNNWNMEPFSARIFRSARRNPRPRGAGSSSGVPRARHRQAQTSSSHSVENRSRNFCGAGGLIPNDNLASHLPVRSAVRADRVPFGPA
jgi:hypothetical protein